MEVQVTHIPGKENCLADLLSRAHLSATNSQKLKDWAIKDNAKLLYVDANVCNF